MRTGGPIDVSGGYFDAGDYLKFVQTTSFVVNLMGVALRDYAPNNTNVTVQKDFNKFFQVEK